MTMKKFAVSVVGKNFLIGNEASIPEKHGFWTTVFIEAADSNAAGKLALQTVESDRNLQASVANPEFDPPVLSVDEVAELDSFEGCRLPGTGFLFYPKEESRE